MKATNSDPIIISRYFVINESLPFSPTSLFQEHHWHRFCPGLTQLAFKCSLLYGFPLLYFPANVRNLCIFSVKKKNVSTREYFVCFGCFVLCFVNQVYLRQRFCFSIFCCKFCTKTLMKVWITAKIYFSQQTTKVTVVQGARQISG